MAAGSGRDADAVDRRCGRRQMPAADRDRVDRPHLPQTEERKHLMSGRSGWSSWTRPTAPAARRIRRNERIANNLLSFMFEIAKRADHVLLGTATPIQTDVEDMWDLLKILGMGAEHVIGDAWSDWRIRRQVGPRHHRQAEGDTEREAWSLFRNPLPAAAEERGDFRVRPRRDPACRPSSSTPGQLQRHQRRILPGSVRGRRADAEGRSRLLPAQQPGGAARGAAEAVDLGALGLIPRIPVDIHPLPGSHSRRCSTVWGYGRPCVRHGL